MMTIRDCKRQKNKHLSCISCAVAPLVSLQLTAQPFNFLTNIVIHSSQQLFLWRQSIQKYWKYRYRAKRFCPLIPSAILSQRFLLLTVTHPLQNLCSPSPGGSSGTSATRVRRSSREDQGACKPSNCQFKRSRRVNRRGSKVYLFIFVCNNDENKNRCDPWNGKHRENKMIVWNGFWPSSRLADIIRYFHEVSFVKQLI